MTSEAVENELDICGLGCALWRGKYWIVAMGVLFALLAGLVSLMMKQTWSSVAIVDRPTANMLGSYYSQSQLLATLEPRSETADAVPPTSEIIDRVYQEFTLQLSSWDTRRDFWQQTDYYKSHRTDDARHNAALLNELVSGIEYTPADAARNVRDTVKLTATTAGEASQLLRHYLAFASARATGNLNAGLTGVWQAQTAQLQAEIKREDTVASATFLRQQQHLQQALQVASQQGSSDAQSEPQLRAQLATLLASGPAYDSRYDQNRALLSTLSAGPALTSAMQPYRYLRTPEEPVTRDSPRRLFMMVMWGVIGALTGAGIALARRVRHNAVRACV